MTPSEGFRTLQRLQGGCHCLWLLGLLCIPVAAEAQLPSSLNLPRPGDRDFVVDGAELVSADDEQRIRGIADKLLSDKAVPILVVTIPSMASAGGEGLRIETFARLLYDQWGIGHERLDQSPWNYGILLLVARDDRKARIELGAGWKRDKDELARQIMDEQIVARFREGRFSEGISQGVESLDKMARDLTLPTPPRPLSAYLIPLAFAGLAVFTVVSLIRRGSSGWAWLFWGAVFTAAGWFLYHMATSSGRGSRGGGSFSGGSFGGGFSGGGGATGSW